MRTTAPASSVLSLPGHAPMPLADKNPSNERNAMTSTISWSASDLDAIASVDDLHIAPRRLSGETGTPTWIWSVAVEGTLYVRPYRGANSSWYQSALQTGTGIIQSGGTTYEVRFAPVDDAALLARV